MHGRCTAQRSCVCFRPPLTNQSIEQIFLSTHMAYLALIWNRFPVLIIVYKLSLPLLCYEQMPLTTRLVPTKLLKYMKESIIICLQYLRGMPTLNVQHFVTNGTIYQWWTILLLINVVHIKVEQNASIYQSSMLSRNE